MKGPGAISRLVLRSVVRKPATVRYPKVKTRMPAGFRGRIVFIPANCIGCKICMKDCPSGAITIRKVGEKRFECEIDLAKCVYCAQCVDSCPKKALVFSDEFELAQLERGKLKVVTHAAPAAEPESKPEPESK